MLTPGYALTATERVLPRLALDFTTAVLDSRVTVTRALNTATRVNSSGYVETVNADLPRFDFSPSSVGTCNGLLIEELRANLCIHSSNYASWSDSGAGVSNSVVTSPDNATNAKEVTRTSGQADARFQAVTFTGDGVKTASIWVRKSTSPSSVLAIYDATAVAYRLWADLTWSGNTPVLSFTGVNGTGSLLASKQFLNDWWRLEFATTSVTAANTNRFYIYPARAGSSNGQGVTCFGVQVENGTFSTSYIPTTTTSLTRNADSVGMTGTNFSSWYSSTTGAILAEWDVPNITGTKCAYYLTNAAETERIRLHAVLSGINRYTISSSGSTIVFNTAAAATGVTKSVVGFKASDYASSFNGATVATNTTLASVPTTPDQLQIGRDGASSYLNGWMRRVAYWPQRLINSEVQSFAK